MSALRVGKAVTSNTSVSMYGLNREHKTQGSTYTAGILSLLLLELQHWFNMYSLCTMTTQRVYVFPLILTIQRFIHNCNWNCDCSLWDELTVKYAMPWPTWSVSGLSPQRSMSVYARLAMERVLRFSPVPYTSTISPYSFIHRLLTKYNRINWQHC